MSNAHNKPSMARPTMVSRASKYVSKKPTTSTSTQRSTERSCIKVESTHNTEFLQWILVAWTISGRLTSGRNSKKGYKPYHKRRTSSIKHYKLAWKKWCGWYSEWKISPTRSNINYVLDLLTELFEKGLEYRTIGTHRSTISVSHDPVGSIQVGNEPRVSAYVSYIQQEAIPTKVSIYLGCRNCFSFSKKASKKWLFIR